MDLMISPYSKRCHHCHRQGHPADDRGGIRLSTIWFNRTDSTFICERCVLLQEDPDWLDQLELNLAIARRDHEPHDEGFHD